MLSEPKYKEAQTTKRARMFRKPYGVASQEEKKPNYQSEPKFRVSSQCEKKPIMQSEPILGENQKI